MFDVICVMMTKVRPQYVVCRDSVGECDVPEFCDGISGQVSEFYLSRCIINLMHHWLLLLLRS